MRVPSSKDKLNFFWSVMVPISVAGFSLFSASKLWEGLVSGHELPKGWLVAYTVSILTFLSLKRRICG